MKQSTKDTIIGILFGLVFGLVGVAVLQWLVERKERKERDAGRDCRF